MEPTFNMMEFAIRFFRTSEEEPRLGTSSNLALLAAAGFQTLSRSMKRTKKRRRWRESLGKEWTWRHFASLVKFTATPIQRSLIAFDDPLLDELAVKTFRILFTFMGDDHESNDNNNDNNDNHSQGDISLVFSLLSICHKHPEIIDEVYCQVVKQTTNNKGVKGSGLHGWRLLSVLANFFPPSSVLKPYLLKTLQWTSYDPAREFSGPATTTLQHLRRTLRCGGRRNVPSPLEVAAVVGGRARRRQMYFLPGGLNLYLMTFPSTIVGDVIGDVCAKIDVLDSVQMMEYRLFYVGGDERLIRPLEENEYIFDVTTQLHRTRRQFSLLFKRVTWHFPLDRHLENRLFVEAIYAQAREDWREGRLFIEEGGGGGGEEEELEAKVTRLARLAAIAEGEANDGDSLLRFIPPSIRRRRTSGDWTAMAEEMAREMAWDMAEKGDTPPIQAKANFLRLVQDFPLFGSAFFPGKSVARPGLRGPITLSVNPHGLYLLDPSSHVPLCVFPYHEIFSSRLVRKTSVNNNNNSVDRENNNLVSDPSSSSEDSDDVLLSTTDSETDSSDPSIKSRNSASPRIRNKGTTTYLDIKCGTATAQKVTRIETDHADEVAALIGLYIEILHAEESGEERGEVEVT